MPLKEDKSAKNAFEELNELKTNYLVDVRSLKEWNSKGVVEFLGDSNKVVLCEWRKYPSMTINENFIDQLCQKNNINSATALYFLCAAGIRSLEAAKFTNHKLEELGIILDCINISDGFDGNNSEFGGAGAFSGWKASGLPWCKIKN